MIKLASNGSYTIGTRMITASNGILELYISEDIIM